MEVKVCTVHIALEHFMLLGIFVFSFVCFFLPAFTSLTPGVFHWVEKKKVKLDIYAVQTGICKIFIDLFSIKSNKSQ